MRRLTQREQFIGILCVLMIVMYGGYNGVVKPLQDRIEETDERIELKRSQLNKNRRMIRKSTVQNGSYDAYREKFRQTKSVEQVMSAMISEIEEAAANLELKIVELKPNRVRKSDFYNQFSVNVSINSAFVDIVQLLYVLQSDPYFYDIEEVRFDKGSRKKSDTLKVRLVLSKILLP